MLHACLEDEISYLDPVFVGLARQVPGEHVPDILLALDGLTPHLEHEKIKYYLAEVVLIKL